MTKNRLFGWEDLDGKWKTGHVDYLVNEFAPQRPLLCLDSECPLTRSRTWGLKMKPYRMTDGGDL